MHTLAEIMSLMETLAPAALAADGDKNGLHAGAATQKITHIFLALDATLAIINAVGRHKNSLLITHHPRFYRGLNDLNEAHYLGKIAATLARKNLALFTAHTNLDVAPNGVNDNLAKIFALENPTMIDLVRRVPDYKLIVFVPRHFYLAVARALSAAGAGKIGNYAECFYRVAGTGTFRPLNGAQPTVGQIGKLCEVEEWRLETIVRGQQRAAVEAALRAAHPYQEPAFDFMPLATTENFGYGRCGKLPTPLTLRALAKQAKHKLKSKNVAVFPSAQSAAKIKTLAVWSGGGVNVESVKNCGADALLCGELNYHALEILHYHKIAVITVGHAESERHILPVLRRQLRAALPRCHVQIAP